MGFAPALVLFRAWSGLATAPGHHSGGRFFSKTPKHEQETQQTRRNYPPGDQQGSGTAGRSHAPRKRHQKRDGRTAQDQPRPGESLAQSKSQSLAFQLDPSGGNRRATGEIDARLTLSQGPQAAPRVIPHHVLPHPTTTG